MEVEMPQAVERIKVTILAASVTEVGDKVYLFTSSAEVTSKINGQTVYLKPGEKALIDANGEIQVSDFDIKSKSKEYRISVANLKSDGCNGIVKSTLEVITSKFKDEKPDLGESKTLDV